jgi:hypothetical protein
VKGSNLSDCSTTTFIQVKVDWLAKRNRYDNDTRDTVQRYLSLNANGTFLWVALVCQELANISRWKAQKKLTAFPPGLDALYRRMMNQIWNSEDAELCKHILAVVSAVYRPVTLDELASFVDSVSGDYEALSEIIGLGGSRCNFYIIIVRRIIIRNLPRRLKETRARQQAGTEKGRECETYATCQHATKEKTEIKAGSKVRRGSLANLTALS